jgi:uncharacterized protein (DUF1778 family)
MGIAKKMDSIGLRISSENKEIIRMAAECMGQDMTSYLVSTALEKARKDILEHQKVETLVLSKHDFEKVEKAIANPREPNERLKRAFKAHKEEFEE